MIQLGCNYSKPLLSLLAQGEVDIDWIKLSREDTLLREVEECRSIRPALVHTLAHAGMPPDRLRQIDWRELNGAIADSRSPHIALHFQIMASDWEEPVTPDIQTPAQRQQMLDRMLRQTEEARSRLAVPLLLENMPYGHRENLRLCVEPDVIAWAVSRTETGLLLDTAHLLCSAWHMGADPRDYALALPLDKVREVHVAGNRLVEGKGLRDVHKELQEEDYAFLSWLLERTRPAIVTLEYGGTGPAFEQPGMNEPEALVRQLHRLKGMLA